MTNDVPPGKFTGHQTAGPPLAVSADHLLVCPYCRGIIDCRDLASVFDHLHTPVPMFENGKPVGNDG